MGKWKFPQDQRFNDSLKDADLVKSAHQRIQKERHEQVNRTLKVLEALFVRAERNFDRAIELAKKIENIKD